MKIAVAVKHAAALQDEFELRADGAAVDADWLEWELNEWDRFSVEEALRLRDEAGDPGGEVLVITVGDEESEEGLLECLAMGADRGIRIRADAQLEAADPLTVARLLAAALEPQAPDLILCGVQSSDAVNGATGTALAGLLDLPRVAVVKSVDCSGETAVVERELEGGLTEVLRVPLPAVLTIQTGINEPRYANLRAIKRAREKPLAVLDPAALGIDPAELGATAGAHLVSLAPPSHGAGGEMLDGSAAAVAARVAEIIRERMAE